MTAQIPEGEELEDLVRRIDTASEGAVRFLDVHQRLGVGPEETETPAAAAAAAFLYIENLVPASGDSYFGPITRLGDLANPPSISKMPDWVLVTWERCADRVAAPVARARLHDLCFEARRGNGRDHVVAAGEAYIELAAGYPSSSGEDSVRTEVALGAVKALERALDLARRTVQDDLASRVLAGLVDAARAALADQDAGSGVVLGFIEPLANDHVQVPELDELLVAARSRYRGDMWNTLSTIRLELLRPDIDAEAREGLHRAEVEALFEGAESAIPMVAVAHLQDAAQRAEKHNLKDLYDKAVARIQDFAGQDMGLVRQEFPVSLPRDVVEGTIENIVGTASWEEAFLRLVGGEPPTGRIERNLAISADQSENSLSTWLPVTRLGPDGLPRHTAATEQERKAYHLAQIEVNTMQVLGGIYVEALRRIGQRFGPIDSGQLAEFLGRNGHVQDGVAAALARSFGRFFSRDPEGAAFTAVPRIERLARELLLKMRAPVFRTARGTTPGQFAGLGVMLSMLEDRGLDPSWSRYLTTLLSRQEGMNYRNELLHGSVDDANEPIAGLTLIAALYLSAGVGLEPLVPVGDT
jgi:hypothetical protein